MRLATLDVTFYQGTIRSEYVIYSLYIKADLLQ